MATKDMTMTNDAKRPGGFAMILWPLAILFGTAMLLGGFDGYNQTMVEKGGTPLPAWAGPLVAFGFGALALAVYVRRYRAEWRQRTPRQRRYWLALGFCAALGGIIGGWLQIANSTDARAGLVLVDGSPLAPGFAIGASALWVFGMVFGMIFYHRAIDDHEEHAWLWAGLAAWYAFGLAAPVWWVLHRASLVPPPDVMLLFLFALIVNAVVWLWLKYR